MGGSFIMVCMSKTPMMEQYDSIKKKHKDAILFFRLGDFYEMFHDDAKIASKVLSLTLTGRGKDDKRIPMCGIPFHAAENYVSKLVEHGYKVAICEQMEGDFDGKGPTPRDVVRVITPGTTQLDPVLESTAANYLVAIHQAKSSVGYAVVDATTGEFFCDVVDSLDNAQRELMRLDAREVLVSDACFDAIKHPSKSAFFPFETQQAETYILNHFNVQSLAVFNIEDNQSAFPAIVAILDYLAYTQKSSLKHIHQIRARTTKDCCVFDQGVMNHLDLFKKKMGLFSLINHTNTSMGSRQLREWLRYPLIDEDKIQTRQQQVTHLINQDVFSKWANLTDHLNDIERLLAKICVRVNNPKDMVALSQSLGSIHDVLAFINQLGSVFSSQSLPLSAIIDGGLQELAHTLNKALLDDVPNHCREGGIFRPGHSQSLDELCESFATIRQWIKALEPQLREQLQIKSLKVGFNKVFGYYIEIPNTHKDKVPDHFIRKQTLTTAERYITTTLKEKETILLNAQQEQANLEKRLYEELIQTVEAYVPHLQEYASIIAHMDAIQSMASVAIKYNFTCPTIHGQSQSDLVIQGLWHPMVAEHQSTPFIRNDVALPKDQPFMLITGPNMAGKSTVMRSVALCVIMGQMGGYVPAEMAHFRIVESLYTRIGASDKLAEGQSTFMVEMVETATICQNADQHSLILLDEIGRGTSTFDGVSIAAAVSEYLVSNIQARTLFATHYHELTALSEKYPQIQNASMKINDDGESLIFAYKLTSGAAEKSYGVMVAKMAGLPIAVTQKAQDWLDKFEKDATTGEIVQLQLF